MKATLQQILSIVPKVCPSCGAATKLSQDMAHLTCTNDDCSGKFARKLEIFAKMFGMDYFGPSNCILLVKKIASFKQLFTITAQDMSDCGLTPGVISNLLEQINQHKAVPLSKFIAAQCISRCGESTAKVLADKYKTLDAILSLSEIDLITDLDRFGEDSAEILISGIRKAIPEISELRKLVVVMDASVQANSPQGSSLAGYTICITGPLSTARDIWKKKIEAEGGKFHSAVSKNTKVLICNKPSTSSKYKKALDLNIPIHDEDWLFDMLKGQV